MSLLDNRTICNYTINSMYNYVLSFNVGMKPLKGKLVIEIVDELCMCICSSCVNIVVLYYGIDGDGVDDDVVRYIIDA